MGSFSPFGKLLVVLILGPPVLIFAVVLVLFPLEYFNLIPCAWEVAHAWELPRDAEVLSCSKDWSASNSFTARMNKSDFEAFARDLGFRPDDGHAEPRAGASSSSQKSWTTSSNGEVYLTDEDDYYSLYLTWKENLLTYEYFE